MKTKFILICALFLFTGCAQKKIAAQNTKTGRQLASLGEVDSSYFKILKIKTSNSKTKENLDVPVFLPGHASKAVTDKINARIKKEISDWGCADDLEEGENVGSSEYSTNLKISATTKKVFSFYYFGDFYCSGAAHPNTYISSLNFDLKTGNEININAQFKNFERDQKKIEAVFIESFAAQNAEQDCVDAYKEISESGNGLGLAFSIAESGLVTWPSLPHAYEFCTIAATVPYNKLKPLLKSKSLLNALAR